MPLLLVVMILFLIAVLVFFKTSWYLNWEAKQKEKKVRQFQERARPAREERMRFMQEEFFPVYKELFRKGPIGYWTDSRDAFNRVVVYEDWEFREDGTGDFIYFTLGTGETRYPFEWRSIGDFEIEMKALKPPAVPGDEEETEEDGDEFFSFLPRESKIKYQFVFATKDFPSITLQSDKYEPEQKPVPGQLEILSLESGPVKEVLKKQFAGKY